jgi:hypothetical protein
MTETKSDNASLAARWSGYRPSKKTWIWSVIGSSVLTMLIGFTAGGWMTSGGATVMSATAARDARAELAASLCVNRFVSADAAAAKFAELKDASFWQREDFIRDGGWADIAGQSPVPGAAKLCAEQLLAMKELPIDTASGTSAGG